MLLRCESLEPPCLSWVINVRPSAVMSANVRLPPKSCGRLTHRANVADVP